MHASPSNRILNCQVYGVPVPGCDGKVGMVAVILKEGSSVQQFDWQAFRTECTKNLPAYSRPVFIRFQSQLAVTSTFKHQKADLVKDGFDPARIGGDAIYFYDWKKNSHEVIEVELFKRICSGDVSI